MDILELRNLKNTQTTLIRHLAMMMGLSFLEEPWTREYLSALDAIGTSPERKRKISQLTFFCDFSIGARYQGVYCLPNMYAAAGAYRASELGDYTWKELSEKSFRLLKLRWITAEEYEVLKTKAEEMEAISSFDWFDSYLRDDDFIHLWALGVDIRHRKDGFLGRLIKPFLNFADEHELPCFLECYNYKLEGLYNHFGFQTVRHFSDPAFDITERCMVRYPLKTTPKEVIYWHKDRRIWPPRGPRVYKKAVEEKTLLLDLGRMNRI